MRELRLLVAMNEIERMAAVAAAELSKRDLDAIVDWTAELDSKMTRFYSKAVNFRQQYE